MIVISAGFKEIGGEGAELERQVAAEARRHRMRLIGPNCLGVMSPVSGLNATFAAAMAPRGRVAFISQSGALVTAVLDWALREKVGFSSIVSLGSMADVGWGDLIDHLGNDRETDAIVMYMETVGDARSFLSAAREVALTKPIIVMKPGRTAEAAKAAASHTGSLAGLGRGPRCGLPARRRAARRPDLRPVLLRRGAGQAAPTARPTADRRDQCRRPGRAGDGRPHRWRRPARAAVARRPWPPSTRSCRPRGATATPSTSSATRHPSGTRRPWRSRPGTPTATACWSILTPQAMTDPTLTAQQLVPFAKVTGKPVMASWMGGLDVEAGTVILRDAGIATFPYPDSAARMFTELWGWQQDLAVAVRDAHPARRRGARGPSRARRGDHRRGPSGGSHHPRRVGIEGAPRCVRHPHHRDAHRADQWTTRWPRPTRSGTPSCSSCSATPSPTRPTWVASSSTCVTPRPCVRPGTSIAVRRRRPAWCRAFRGGHRPADDRLGRLRAHRGQLHRRPVRAGAAVRAGRPAGRGLP